ncbi:nucleotidyltransferase domain-containing protein [Sulfolobus sp. S-194]|uniref:nucleotidyltransferase domain-containing protein n=1 Tax=Sulfolobus sp. S-194 TaxID=2512240 RepID=UPI001436D109|nr:nucleotidyltransferase domain-containing protein [Sulfolobus sp. S-194]QIW24690.1 nucleotidyltransferase domain-containing protein [Sulfolobus sp. S-194]
MVWGLDYINYLESNWRMIAEEVKSVAKKFGKVDKVIVFGSMIKGKVTGNSDLDIAVFYNEELTDKEKIKRALEILNEVNEEIAVINIQVLMKSEEDFFLKFIGDYIEI